LVPRSELPRDFAENADPWTAYLDADAVGSVLTLRPRLPGDRFQPHGLNGHSARVNEYMINAKLPAAARPGWPILEGDSGVAWICGLRIDGRAAVRGHTTRAWQVSFER
jgi:tRNA(Ile)-lysidine synthetase-like protein